MSRVLTKSSQGLREASGKTTSLAPGLREILLACKGQFTLDSLAAAPGADRAALARGIDELLAQGYLREVMSIDDAAEPPAVEDETADRLRADIAARRGQRDDLAQEQVRQAEEAARRHAEAQAAAQAAAAREHERELAEAARQKAERQARLDAQEQARQTAVQAALHTFEEKEREAAEEAARQAAAEAARREAEEAVRREAEERARRKAEEAARREAEERARLEQEERDREAIRERIRRRNEQRRRAILPLALAAVLIGLLLVQLVPFEGTRKALEARAGAALGVPVTIESAHLALLPTPRWQLGGIRIGEVRIARARAALGWGELFSLPANFASLRLEEVRLPFAALPRALQAPALGAPLLVASQVSVADLAFDDDGLGLPPLAAEARLDGGRLATLAVRGNAPETQVGAVSVEARRETGWRFTLALQRLRNPVSAKFPLTDVKVEGELGAAEARIDRFAARLFEGDLEGSGRLAWGPAWTLAGNLKAQRVDAAKLAPAWFRDGYITAQATLAGSAPAAAGLVAATTASGEFSLGRGWMLGVDFSRALEGRGVGEQFQFDSLGGRITADAQRARLSELRLTAGGLTARGGLDIEAGGAVDGRVQAEVATPGARLAATLKMVGTAAAPQYQR